MSKQKFKVGDRVRVVMEYPGIRKGNRCGKTGTIMHLDEYSSPFPYYVRLDGEGNPNRWIFVNEVEHIKKKHPVIVITSDGKTTTATMREGKKVIKTATATCSDKDTFDYDEGARIAFERLQGREPFLKEEKKNALFSGKVVCIDVKGIRVPYTVGKTYRCEKERNFSGDDSEKYCCYLGTRADAENTFRVGFLCGEAFFIPLVED